MSENLNTTMNGTQPSTCYWNPTAEEIGKSFSYCLVFLVSLAGNTVIGIIVYKTKTMRSDLLFPIFLIPLDIQLLYINSWLIDGPLGQVLCKLVSFLPMVSLAVSVQSLVLIAVDRFGAVVFPLRSPLIILATWIVAMAINSPYLFSKLVEDSGGLVCTAHWKDVFGESLSNEIYLVSWCVTFVFIPLLLIATLYITAYVKLKSQKIPGKQSANAGQQRQQRERNVLKMAIPIALGFAACVLPFGIYWLLVVSVSDISSCGFQYFSFFAFFVIRINCALNPCICFIFSRNYRIGLKTLFR